MKTLDQIASTGIAINSTNTPPNGNYLYVINNPGSYYLTGNVAVISNTGSGIHVTAAGVTIEMNGFQVSGPPSAGNGIYIDETAHRCTVKNGTITGFANGVQASNDIGNARGGSFLQLAVSACSSIGLRSGDAWQIDGCKIHDNANIGIGTGSGNTLTNCTATHNTGYAAISADQGCTLANCTANDNSSGFGIDVSPGSTLTNCYVNNNSSDRSISAASGSTLTNCAANNNSGRIGIYALNSTLTNCTANHNTGSLTSTYGIYADGGTVTGCTAIANANSNSPGPNTGVGIYAGMGSTVKGCTVSGNKGDGIQFASWCLISGNNSTSNGARGFASVGGRRQSH